MTTLTELLNTEEGKAEFEKALSAAIEKEVGGLKTKNDELITKFKSVRERADAIEAEKLSLAEKLEALDHEAATKSGDVNKVREQLVAKHKVELEKLNGSLTQKDQTLNKLVIDNGITDALSAASVAPHHIPAVRALLKMENKIEISDNDGNPSAMVNGQGLGDFVKDWASGDVGKHYVTAPNNGGGGAAGTNKSATGANVKTITRSQFDGLGARDRTDYIKEGGKVVNE